MSEKPIEVKRLIGVVPEDLGLFDLLTIEEHLELAGPIYGLKKQEIRDRMAPLLRVLKLEHARNFLLSQCSYGMRKKTALALALLHNPRVLLLDEPFEGLDPASSKMLQELFVNIAERGVTVFFTSHILSAVEQIASSILMIRSGRIIWMSKTGRPEQPLEEIYLKLAEEPKSEDISWLGF